MLLYTYDGDVDYECIGIGMLVGYVTLRGSYYIIINVLCFNTCSTCNYAYNNIGIALFGGSIICVGVGRVD